MAYQTERRKWRRFSDPSRFAYNPQKNKGFLDGVFFRGRLSVVEYGTIIDALNRGCKVPVNVPGSKGGASLERGHQFCFGRTPRAKSSFCCTSLCSFYRWRREVVVGVAIEHGLVNAAEVC